MYSTITLRKYLRVRGGNVSVRAEDNVYPAVVGVADRDLLSRRLCVHVEDGKIVLALALIEHLVDRTEGRVENGIDMNVSHSVYDEHTVAVAIEDLIAVSRHSVAEIHRAKYLARLVEIGVRRLIAKGVVSAGDAISTSADQLIGKLG